MRSKKKGGGVKEDEKGGGVRRKKGRVKEDEEEGGVFLSKFQLKPQKIKIHSLFMETNINHFLFQKGGVIFNSSLNPSLFQIPSPLEALTLKV